MISIFTSPITQQMIAYKTRPAPIPNGIADVPISRTYTQDPAGIVHPEEVTRAVFQGMSSHPSTPILPIAASCGAANCTFSRYTTLAMCMKMRDVTPLLTVTELQNTTSPMWTGGRNWERAVLAGNGTTAWNASLPNGISFVTPLSYAFALTGHNETLSFTTPADQDANYNALAHYFAIWSNAGNVSYPGFDRASHPTPWPFIAHEILYHLCVNTYETTFSGGQSNTTLISSSAVPAARADNEPLYNLGCVPSRNLIFDTCDYLDITANRTYLADPTDPAAPPFAMDREVGAALSLKLYFDVQLTFVADGIGRNAAVYNNRNVSPPLPTQPHKPLTPPPVPSHQRRHLRRRPLQPPAPSPQPRRLPLQHRRGRDQRHPHQPARLLPPPRRRAARRDVCRHPVGVVRVPRRADGAELCVSRGDGVADAAAGRARGQELAAGGDAGGADGRGEGAGWGGGGVGGGGGEGEEREGEVG